MARTKLFFIILVLSVVCCVIAAGCQLRAMSANNAVNKVVRGGDLKDTKATSLYQYLNDQASIVDRYAGLSTVFAIAGGIGLLVSAVIYTLTFAPRQTKK